MEINKENLIRQLESVSAGLSPNEIIEQSSCFVFKDGHVHTFNEEIACTCPCALPVTGAVVAGKFLTLLKKIPDETIKVEQTESEIIIKGKRRKAGLRMEAEILLPLDAIERPENSAYRTLPDRFPEAAEIICESISKDNSRFHLTCIHMHPEWIESCDGFQLARCDMSTGVGESILVRGEAVKKIAQLGMLEIAETDSWVHFRGAENVTISVRKYIKEYPDLTEFINVRGIQTTLPKGIVEAAEIAEIFSSGNVENNEVSIELGNGRVRVRGESSSGWYSETKRMKDSVDPIEFMIAPKLLKEIVKYPICEIMQESTDEEGRCVAGKLKVTTDLFTWVVCLGSVEK